MIELIVYPKSGKEELINPSPFCSKTEIFLKLAKIDYTVTEFNGNPGQFPNGKLPVIKHDGKVIADSSFIQTCLEDKFQVNLDKKLSDQEKAQGFAFVKMIEEYFYWSILHERWLIDQNWQKLKIDFFSHIPGLIRGLITSMIRKGVKKSALGHGMARHSDDEVLEIGRQCIRAIANFLNEKNFLLGETISSYDTSVYAFVSSILHSELGPELRQEAQQHQNLINYDQRMFETVFKA